MLRVAIKPTILTLTLLWFTGAAAAQEVVKQADDAIESDFEIVLKAEADLEQIKSGFPRDPGGLALRARKSLKNVLERDVDTPFALRINEDLGRAEEILATHHFIIATFYLGKTTHGAKKGAESRLRQIVVEYPSFSKMDEVLLRLSELAFDLEHPEDASYFSNRLICANPNSTHLQEAFEQIYKVGGNVASCDELLVRPLPATKP